MRLSLVVATDLDCGIGKNGTMPWPRLPRDMARFKAVTMGKPVILGRKTWDSIGKPLPGRNLIVVSRDPSFTAPSGVQLARDIPMALDLASGWGEEGVVAGGGEIYGQLLHRCERLYLTSIIESYDCDTFFHAGFQWKQVSTKLYPADEKNPADMIFADFVRPEGWTR